jgi:hypothetical protein
MNKQTLTLKVVKTKRIRNSHYGNPNYRLTLEAENGHTFTADTMNDYMINYGISLAMEGKKYQFTLKVNRKSNKVLDYKPVEEA